MLRRAHATDQLRYNFANSHPSPPKGKEANWVSTDPKGSFELLFRLYGPEKPFFDKEWKLPDVERVSAR